MVVMVGLLRGVNVGGNNKLPMADLRHVAEESGHQNVATYIQSGNVVFWSSAHSTAQVASDLERAIAAETSLAVDVVVRTHDDLLKVTKVNPYLHCDDDLSHLFVGFMHGDLTAPTALAALAQQDAYLPDEVSAIGRELYLYLPAGGGRSRLAADLVRKKAPSNTMRNWRTVTKLVEMCGQIAASRTA